MKTFATMIVAGFALVAASTAQAEVSTDDIGTAMEENGFTVVEVSHNMVAVLHRGLAIMIAVDGADGDVSYLTYLEDVKGSMIGYEFLNRFNNEVKFGRAYVDRDGDVAIQMDRNSSGGVSVENIESDFDVFITLVQKFLADVSTQAVA